jgi:hypothetical protein
MAIQKRVFQPNSNFSLTNFKIFFTNIHFTSELLPEMEHTELFSAVTEFEEDFYFANALKLS